MGPNIVGWSRFKSRFFYLISIAKNLTSIFIQRWFAVRLPKSHPEIVYGKGVP